MKSLEIVNDKLSYEEEIISKKGNYYCLTKEQLEQIKSDLEILKIFNKFFGDVNIILYEWEGEKRGQLSFDGTDYCTYTKDENEALEMFELKQWLEENH